MTKITLRTFKSHKKIELTFEKNGAEYDIDEAEARITDYDCYSHCYELYICIDWDAEKNINLMKAVAEKNGAVLRVEIFEAPVYSYFVSDSTDKGTLGYIELPYDMAGAETPFAAIIDDLRARLMEMYPDDADEILNGEYDDKGATWFKYYTKDEHEILVHNYF